MACFLRLRPTPQPPRQLELAVRSLIQCVFHRPSADDASARIRFSRSAALPNRPSGSCGCSRCGAGRTVAAGNSRVPTASSHAQSPAARGAVCRIPESDPTMNAPCLLPDRRSALLPRLLGALAIVLAAATPLALAHEGVAHVAPAAASVPARELQGKLVAITVTNRMSGQMQRVAALDVAGGHRYLLRNATSLQEGATVVRHRPRAGTAARRRRRAHAGHRTVRGAQDDRAARDARRHAADVPRRLHRWAACRVRLLAGAGLRDSRTSSTSARCCRCCRTACAHRSPDRSTHEGYIAVDTIDLLAPSTLTPPRERVTRRERRWR